MRNETENLPPARITLTKGNAKLQKPTGEAIKIVGFGIPADYTFRVPLPFGMTQEEYNTCPGALACRAVCYAKQGRYTMPNVANARRANLAATLSPEFVPDMVAALSRLRSYNTVRIHDSGDFYSQEYYNKWCDIARALPNLTFYAYTKTLFLDLEGNRPENLRLTQSLGGRFDAQADLNRSHSRIFATDADRLRAGYIDGNASDLPAISGLVQIGLTYHGNRKLTQAQAEFFS